MEYQNRESKTDKNNNFEFYSHIQLFLLTTKFNEYFQMLQMCIAVKKINNSKYRIRYNIRKDSSSFTRLHLLANSSLLQLNI